MSSCSSKNDGSLLSTLQHIQDECGYLPEERLREVARVLGMSLVDIYGVATFYSAFSFVPRGRHQIKVCLGTACHVRGSTRIRKEIEKRLGIKPGETSEDGEFSLDAVMCLGCCAIGPVVVVDQNYYGQVTVSEVGAILSTAREAVDAN